jgi:hypothetical protein
MHHNRLILTIGHADINARSPAIVKQAQRIDRAIRKRRTNTATHLVSNRIPIGCKGEFVLEVDGFPYFGFCVCGSCEVEQGKQTKSQEKERCHGRPHCAYVGSFVCGDDGVDWECPLGGGGVEVKKWSEIERCDFRVTWCHRGSGWHAEISVKVKSSLILPHL